MRGISVRMRTRKNCGQRLDHVRDFTRSLVQYGENRANDSVSTGEDPLPFRLTPSVDFGPFSARVSARDAYCPGNVVSVSSCWSDVIFENKFGRIQIACDWN